MFIKDKINDINRRLKDLENIHNIVVWGAGVHTGKLFENTDLFSYNIKNIVDIDKKKQGSSFFGFMVMDPEEIAWGDVGAVVISVPNKENQIIETLKKIGGGGFSGNIVTLYNDNESTPFYLLYKDKDEEICYLGDYGSWEEAYSECEGYEDGNIINTVIDATKKVLDGDAVWERDGYLFYEQQYIYHICSVVLKCALQNKNQGVRILDIGGSLGSTYFQNRHYLTDINNLEYVIAEQDHFADYGRENLENDTLKFIRSTDNWDDYGKFDIVLMSASLQYIPQYEEIVSRIVSMKPTYIILDRVLVSDRMRICRETVPEKIYKSSYPVYIFSEDQIVNFFAPGYKVVEKDISSVPEWAYFIDGRAVSRYYVFQKESK